MSNKPFALTRTEIKEIASLRQIQELWGAQNFEEMQNILAQSYSVRFSFVSGSPGYVGDLFVIQGDALDGEVPPVRLIRENSNLVILG